MASDGTTTGPVLETAQHTYVPQLESAGRARKFVQAVLRDWGIHPDDIELGMLLVSEAVTNAVIHCGGRPQLVDLQVYLGLEEVTFVVTDRNQGVIVLREQTPQATNGKGVFLIHSLAREWSVSVLPDGAGNVLIWTIAASPMAMIV